VVEVAVDVFQVHKEELPEDLVEDQLVVLVVRVELEIHLL
tara:strand:+ start:677 stop:796 length:120 start_codon:yes stop_codon:yes gene_type:complete